MVTCSLEAWLPLEAWLSVKILITEFQAFDPAIPALAGVKPQVSLCCDSNRQLTEPHRILSLCPSLRREGWNNQCVQRHW